VWLDKRDFLSGYDVYAAFDTGTRRFGKKSPGAGQLRRQHGAVACDWSSATPAAGLLALWDDARDGTPDVWLSEWEGEAFGDDMAVPGGAGPGEQSDPVATLDAAGALHVVWLDRDEAAGTRIRYARAVRKLTPMFRP
jgi:hypothetical protein